jgi:hypothetical protein
LNVSVSPGKKIVSCSSLTASCCSKSVKGFLFIRSTVASGNVSRISGSTLGPSQVAGGCHDEADAKWIIIRGPSMGHSNTPFGRPTPGRHIGRPGVGNLQDVFGVFSYYLLVMLFLNMVCLTVAHSGLGRVIASRQVARKFILNWRWPPIGVQRGVSKRVEDGRRPPAGRRRVGHGLGATLGSPWRPLAIRPCGHPNLVLG